MIKEQTISTRFHLKVDTSLKKILSNHSNLFSLSLGDTINMILYKIMPVIDVMDLKFCGRLIKIEDPEAVSEDLIVNIDLELKYKLFSLQNHFKLRSKGSLLRLIIRLYFAKQKKLGANRLSRIIRRFEHFKRLYTGRIFKSKSNLTHMCQIGNTITSETYSANSLIIQISMHPPQ